MSKKVVLLTVLSLLVAALAPLAAHAQSATSQTWSTSITYYTPSDTGGTLVISYYPEGSSTSIDADPITLSPHKAGSLYIGSVPGMTSTFAGGAVLLADVPVVAAAVNIAGDAAGYPRPLYSGFDPAQASANFLIPTVLFEAFGTNSLVSIQNVESFAIDATLRVFEPGNPVAVFEHTYAIPAQSAQLVPAADMGLPSGFSGSATVEGADGARVVAAAQETDNNARSAKAFEGLAADAGSPNIFMASMMCQAYGGQTSYYAIQNAGGADANVEIDFYGTDGSLLDTASGITIGIGNKVSVNPCSYIATGIAGSAVIRSTNAMPLVAMGKIAGGGLSATAFLGQSEGFTKVAAPYIRWKADPTTGERSYVAVMNVGGADATDVVVNYYDNTGSLAASHTLATGADPMPQFIKANSNPDTAGALDGSGNFGVDPYGGAIEVVSDQPVIVVVRVARAVRLPGYTLLAEDYNGVSVP